mgnify:CR=1 FL=1
MKYFLVTFLILFLVGAAFGFMLMNHNATSHSTNAVPNCAIPLLDSVVCTGDVIGMAMHHISAFNSFLQFQISSFDLSLLAFSIFAVFLILFSIFLVSGDLFLTPLWRLKFETTPISTHRKTLRWLSLFENSPPFFIERRS